MDTVKHLYFIVRSPENYTAIQIALIVIFIPVLSFYKLFLSLLTLIALRDSTYIIT